MTYQKLRDNIFMLFIVIYIINICAHEKCIYCKLQRKDEIKKQFSKIEYSSLKKSYKQGAIFDRVLMS